MIVVIGEFPCVTVETRFATAVDIARSPPSPLICPREARRAIDV
jgi:hypothetical protein